MLSVAISERAVEAELAAGRRPSPGSAPWPPTWPPTWPSSPMLASKLVSTPGTLAPVPVTAAAIASPTRLTLAKRDTRRCLAARAALA